MDSNNKRIAKNAIMLYIRMLLSVLIGLYTSRVVLQVLGAENYGIYGVVGSVVGMMGFIQGAMVGATSRFITYEMGQGDDKRLSDTFSSSMLIHFGICLIIILLGETVGLWFLYNKLVIPEDRMVAAIWVYQLSLLSAIIGVTQTPYNAVIMSHEKMDIFAYFELLNVFLKLVIVYLLVIGSYDKLILYAILSFLISLFMRMLYRVYCIRHYPESRFRFVWNWKIVKPLLSFSGYDTFGNVSVIVFTQGISFLLNIFFGPILNAANGIATTVQGVIKGFTYNVISAFRPQIIKQFSAGNLTYVTHLTIHATKSSLVFFSIIAMPVFYNVDYVLHLWLGEYPDFTSSFLRIILVGTIFNLANLIVNIPIHANGNMKLFSIATGSWFIVSIFVMYFILKLGFNPIPAYSVIIFTYFFVLITALFMLKRNVPTFPIKVLLLDGYLKYIVCLSIIVLVYNLFSFLFSGSLSLLLFSVIYSLIVWPISYLFVFLNRRERIAVLHFVKRKFPVFRKLSLPRFFIL